MKFKKQILAVAAAGALTAATAVPAMALENEFHGLYRAFLFGTNAETGGGTFNLNKSAKDSYFAEQRARLMYIAKASDNLKLVTHFELDARFGGQSTEAGSAAANKYPLGDAGGLDADRISLETKNIYLDFNVPSTPVNMKVGIQPFGDAYQGVFGAFDGTGAVASAKMGDFTPTLGYFRFTDNRYIAKTATASEIMPGKKTLDMVVLDGKFAVNKDLVVGASYYNVQNDQATEASAISAATVNYELLHMLGVNAAGNVGPAALSGFFAYQFGDYKAATNRDLSAYAAAAMAKVAVGPGKVNASVLYLSGDKGNTTGDFKAFRQLDTTGTVSYFNPSNMWLLVRNGASINSSTAIGGTDLTKGDRGLLGLFAGYEMAVGKAFGTANIGYGKVNEKREASSSSIGTEINATIGYKVYDNLSASFTAAYLVLGNFSDKVTGAAVVNPNIKSSNLRVNDASNPYLTAIQLNYTF